MSHITYLFIYLHNTKLQKLHILVEFFVCVPRQYGDGCRLSVVGEVFCVTGPYLTTTATPALTWVIASLPDHSLLSAVEVFLKEVLIGHFYLVILGNTF